MHLLSFLGNIIINYTCKLISLTSHVIGIPVCSITWKSMINNGKQDKEFVVQMCKGRSIMVGYIYVYSMSASIEHVKHYSSLYTP